MTQSMWKEHNRFVQSLLPNDLVVNEYNTLKKNILMKPNIGTKNTRKGDINFMEGTEESINPLLLAEQQSRLCSV